MRNSAHTVTNTWLADRGSLDWKENTAGATVISKYDYAVNNVDQRTGVDVSGTAFGSVAAIAWGYDALGQVDKADHPTAAKDFGYKFDGIGNRKRSSRNTTNPDTATGANLAVYRQDTASAGPEGGNTLNQYGRLERIKERPVI